MSKLTDLMTAVREENLTKPQLESYFQQLTDLFAQLQLEMAGLEKEQAIFLATSEEKTDAAKSRVFQATASGLRLIELKRYDKALSKLLSATRHRIYSTY